MLKEIRKEMIKWKIGRWVFDIVSFGIYFLTVVFFTQEYNISIGILSSIAMFLFINELVRKHFLVKPYNTQVDIVNSIENIY